MKAELDQHIDQLRQMTTAQLQLRYRELFGQPSHSNHKDYLFRRVAWRMQALAEGGLSERAREYARAIATDADLRLCAPKKAIEGLAAAIRPSILEEEDWCTAVASKKRKPFRADGHLEWKSLI